MRLSSLAISFLGLSLTLGCRSDDGDRTPNTNPDGAAASMGGGGGAGGEGSGGTGGTGGQAPAVIGPLTWNSHEVVVQMGPPQGYVDAVEGGNRAELRFSEALDDASIADGTLLSTFVAGDHPEAQNKAKDLWSSSSNPNKPYPYVGKSTVGRGMDTAEMMPPMPEGVFDLQLHPPEMAKLSVIAFVVPIAGKYTVTNVAARKAIQQGGPAAFKIFAPDKALIATVTAQESGTWARSTDESYILGTLAKDDVIYFAVDRVNQFYFDATEIAWTLKREP